MRTDFTPEEQEVLNKIKDSFIISDFLDNSDYSSPDIIVEDVCPDDLIPDIKGELMERLNKYKDVLKEYTDKIKKKRPERNIDDHGIDSDHPEIIHDYDRLHREDTVEEYDPVHEYERLSKRLNEIVNEITSNNCLQSTTYLDCLMPLVTFGMYTPKDKKIHIFIKTIRSYASTNGYNAAHMLGTVYVHECYHALVDYIAGCSGMHYIREIEEPLAECYMLDFFKVKHDKTNDITFKQIYDLACKTVKDKQNGLVAAYGYGYYLHESSKKNHHISPFDICKDYSLKAKDIDHNSINVISYCLELMLDYPPTSNVPQEAEKILFGLLIHQILNIGQKQELSFVNLFENTKKELKQSLLEKWQPKGTPFDSNYQQQIKNIIDNTISENILVENMSPWQSAEPVYKNGLDYTAIVNQDLLQFLPYQHQVECWDALLAPSTTFKSMVVTTGTGSGKTESFMVPLITDLSKSNATGLKAIFLYPLNALMEDQKKKLNDLIDSSGSQLTFAVYNGNSPEGDYDPNVGNKAFSHEVLYREQIRGLKLNSKGKWAAGGRIPDIILTNPTMLEYLLLRRADRSIINKSQRVLSWIVIDETHSYNGAGADELAMLIRRVLKAFDRKSNDIHFATSSATAGNDDKALLKFISGITGQERDDTGNQLIKVIKGHRSLPDFSLAKLSSDALKASLLAKLAQNDYVYLRDLIPYKSTTYERLTELDKLCQGGLKVKVHFFVEALTNGLYANMEDIMNGSKEFQLTPEIPYDQSTFQLDSRYLRIMHCTKCGAILANTYIDSDNNYSRVSAIYSQFSQFIAINNGKTPQKNTEYGDILTGNKISVNNNYGSIIKTEDCSCPMCGVKNTNDELNILAFNVSSTSVMAKITPILLDNTISHDGDHPYQGRQFISFSDSRRGAAEPSMEQNLETENKWVITTILKQLSNTYSYTHVLNELTKQMTDSIQHANTTETTRLQGLLGKLAVANNNQSEIITIANQIGITGTVSWEYVLNLLYSDNENCNRLASCFAKEEDLENGRLSDDYLKKYALAALYNTMSSRSKYGFSPESYGMFQTEYEDLNNLSDIPKQVKSLNCELTKHGLKIIDLEDWKDYLKIYLDFHVRTNENLFFRSSNAKWNKLDINDCRNLKTKYSKRRSIKDPTKTYGIHYRLLWRLFNCNDEKELANIDPIIPGLVADVVKAMWEELTQKLNILEIGYTYKKPYKKTRHAWVQDYLSKYEEQAEMRTNYRLNVSKISFRLCKHAFREENIKAILDTTFKGHSPYQIEYIDNSILPKELNNWEPKFPSNDDSLRKYYSVYGVEYLYCSDSRDIYAQKPIFIQYEHTAQVGRELTKSRIEDFRNHDINILACSTTMEMGVDLGELEIVSMSNVPPHPANYKQRVGRAGRAFQNKSASVTMCNSDAMGLSVMKQPKEALIERELLTPSADLNSPQVIQRHINSYLLRKYLVDGNIPSGFDNRSIKSYAIIDFFFDEKYDIDPPRNIKNNWRDLVMAKTKITPDLYDSSFHDNSLYNGFCTWLLNLKPSIDKEVWDDLDLLKSGTALKNVTNNILINNTLKAIKELFDCLTHEFEQIQKYSTGLDSNGNKILDANGNPLVDWSASPITGYTARLHYDFMGLLMENLIIFCSTHQFTPNANMPVNIVKLKINHDDISYSNPSRDLVIALTEYSPGKSVVIDGKSYNIAGVEWDRSKSIQRIHVCKKCGYTWENGADSQCPSCEQKDVRHNDMIEPTAFLPEQETDRIMDKVSQPTSVKAQLIGHDGIHLTELSPLCDFDVEYPNPGTKILFLNDGAGFGYCICQRFDCGRAVAENKTAPDGDSKYLRDLMYSRINPDDPQQHPTYEHQNLATWGQDLFNVSDLRRNMFIGGSISTNYSILKPYYTRRGARKPFTKKESIDDAIITTLGLLVCDELSKKIPCQRQDIDFLITTLDRGERALCIYDTSKGGAGYSSYLDKTEWLFMLDQCKQRLSDIINKKEPVESLFSRSTLRYINEINIMGTYNWLNEEYIARHPIPQTISNHYNSAVLSSIGDIADEIKQAIEAILFVQGDINKWNYELSNGSVPSWKDTRSLFKLSGNKKTKLAFCGDPGIIPVEAIDIIKHSEDWAEFALYDRSKDVFPIAYLNGTLYVTDDASTADFNGSWGSGGIYAIKTSKPAVKSHQPSLSGYSEFFISKSTRLISSKDLLNTLIKTDITDHHISDFINDAKGHAIEITYMDEHLKNQLGIIISIQLIEAFVNMIGCNYFTVNFVNEKYYDHYGKGIGNISRNLTDSFQSSDDSNQMINTLLSTSGWNYKIDTKLERSLPHWRCLTIKDKDTNSMLTVKPHGGIANGWYIDTATTLSNNIYFNSHNSDISSDIPIISSKENDILYTIGLSK